MYRPNKSALEADFSALMRYINSRFTYLLTYLLTYFFTSKLTCSPVPEIIAIAVLGGVVNTQSWEEEAVGGSGMVRFKRASESSYRPSIVPLYRAMHYSAKHGIAIACRPSVHPSVTLMDHDHIGPRLEN